MEPPVLYNCPNDTVIGTDTGLATRNYSWTAPTADDNADDNPWISSNIYSPHVFEIGVHNITFNATDDSANVATCSFTVDVRDTEPPSFNGTCPSSPLEVPTDTRDDRPFGEMFATVTWNIPTAIDNVNVTMITNSSYPGLQVYFNLSSLYDLNVTYIAFDEAGNKELCNFLVKVIDVENPFYYNCDNTSGAADVTLYTSVGVDYAPYSWSPPISGDNIEIDAARSSTNMSPGQDFSIGVTDVVDLIYDTSGNKASCNFTVTVIV
ncbi:hyalin-like [Anneissia japonica]|uniref:hyalin-like n=1 Tax=Anneissia japonica TaxID=1529436 RepID=UPI0014254DD2|nr:hyalin-like [Anneissia japonica]